MVFVENAEVIEGLGLRGDRHAIPGSPRQILLIEEETLNDLGLWGGAVRENITTRGLELMRLQQGQRIQLGEAVLLEVTKACTPCGRMDEIRNGLQAQLVGRRGILARVVRGGTIKLGDVITVV